MQLCDYGCGREGKYPLKNGRWCCEVSQNKCSEVRRKNGESNKSRIRLPHSKETKKKIGKANKGIKNWNYGKLPHNKLTIEKIQEKYPTFTKEEEMKYNPDKPGEKEIQFHCKKCNKWFTPTYWQLAQRRDALEHDDGNDGSYFYCSKGCKQECCLFRLKSDPNTLNEYEKYNIKVWKLTNITLEKNFDKIKNIELRGKKYGYALDHKYSIYDGFISNVDHEIIGHYRNLECIPEIENFEKNKNSSITLEILLEEIRKD